MIPNFKENLNICPVFNINNYLKTTFHICNNFNIKRPNYLWIDSKDKVLSQAKMRIWFRNIIFQSDPNAQIPQTKFHSIRGHVATTLDLRGIDTQNILSKMNWKNSSTFKKFYAKLNLISKCQGVIGGIAFKN